MIVLDLLFPSFFFTLVFELMCKFMEVMLCDWLPPYEAFSRRRLLFCFGSFCFYNRRPTFAVPLFGACTCCISVSYLRLDTISRYMVYQDDSVGKVPQGEVWWDEPPCSFKCVDWPEDVILLIKIGVYPINSELKMNLLFLIYWQCVLWTFSILHSGSSFFFLTPILTQIKLQQTRGEPTLKSTLHPDHQRSSLTRPEPRDLVLLQQNTVKTKETEKKRVPWQLN